MAEELTIGTVGVVAQNMTPMEIMERNNLNGRSDTHKQSQHLPCPELLPLQKRDASNRYQAR
jgi:hypothetical protein